MAGARAREVNKLTAERARALLSYDPTTGELRWRVGGRARVKPGDLAGRVQGAGYRVLSLDGERYMAHRVIWLMQTGEWPAEELDHRHRQKANNQWVELREATRTQNVRNVGLRKDNSSGVRGVRQVRSRWRAKIRVGGRPVHLGYFSTRDAAERAYQAAAAHYFGEFAP